MQRKEKLTTAGTQGIKTLQRIEKKPRKDGVLNRLKEDPSPTQGQILYHKSSSYTILAKMSYTNKTHVLPSTEFEAIYKFR